MDAPSRTLSQPLGLLLLGIAPATAQTTSVLSAGPYGSTGNGKSALVALSGDARWAVFGSAASNLVPYDGNGVEDIFVRDLWSGSLVLASVSSSGEQGQDYSRQPQISEDGRFVVFQSIASNLVSGDTNDATDIFVRDLWLGLTTRVSVTSSGAEVSGGARYPYISRDGQIIVFESSSPDLVPGDDNGVKDVFVHERASGLTVRVSVNANGQAGNAESLSPAISPDGRYVGYSSLATNLVNGDTNDVMDVFVHDRLLGFTRRVSCAASGAECDGTSAQPSLSQDGRYVAFFSRSSNLVPGDINHVGDVFVKDLLTGALELASVSTSGTQAEWQAYSPRITPDGRYVAFFSEAATLVPGDTNSVADAFVRDLQLGTTRRATLSVFGQQSNAAARYPVLSDDGRWVAFECGATNLVVSDANGQWDIFLRDMSGSFHPTCLGDGTQSIPCPCGNVGGPGRGCENSNSSGGALLDASGTCAADNVVLTATGLSGGYVIFLQGDALLASPVVFGDGLRCAGGSLARLYVASASAGTASAPSAGQVSIHTRSAQLGDDFASGAERHYQAWYRDAAPGFCTSATTNLSSGLRIDW